jgi:CRP-like cAMP-binding protein
MTALSLPQVCRVLEEDPELAEGIDERLRAQATRTLLAPQVLLPIGRWPHAPLVQGCGLGMLLLDGVVLHRVGVDQRFGAELLGQGDVLRRAYRQEESTLSPTNAWSILEPVRLAVLDERFAAGLARFPELGGRLLARALSRTRQLAVNMAIVHQARVDVRLHMLLWHLAGRWGRVRRDGVLVPLRLTHSVLSDLVAARRPTVTSALTQLDRRGVVHAVDEGWLLSGDPPCTSTPT